MKNKGYHSILGFFLITVLLLGAFALDFWDKFTPKDIANLELIYHLVKERGFTLEGAKTHLKENRQQTLDNFEIIRKLERVKAELIKIKDQL